MNGTTATRYPVGTPVEGRYEVLSLLSRGGTADVYAAIDRRLGRRVAVKVLREGLTGDDGSLARFRREARAAAALGHPHIVAVHDTGIENGVPYIVMEHVEGRTLAEVLAQDGPLPAERVAEVGTAVASALGCAHAAGIVHRDLKPGNIMLTEAGEVKVVDFGIARAARWTPLTDGPAVQGTAEYLSPEQARGDEVDGRSDLYSLGAVLYELVTGRPPFRGETPVAVAYKHLEEAPAPPDALHPGVPPALSAIVMRCLAKSPGDRYAGPEGLGSDLVRFRAGGPASTVPFPPPPPTDVLPLWGGQHGSSLRRRRRWAVPTLVAVALAVGGAGVLGIRAAEPPRPTRAPLPPPTALVAQGSCDGFLKGQVALRWAATRAGSADGYQVYRATASGGPYEVVGRVTDRNATSFLDPALRSNTTYFYVVAATAGTRTGPLSGQAQAATPFACLW